MCQGRNRTISSREREMEISFGYVTLMDASRCTGEVGRSVADASLAVGLCQYNCNQNLLAKSSKWTL